MKLFVIDSFDMQLEFFAFVAQKDRFWINGRRDAFGPWFSYNPEKNPIFPGLSWSARRTPAGCLSACKVGKALEITATKCDEALRFYCENKMQSLQEVP